jgi:hypothetical protein
MFQSQAGQARSVLFLVIALLAFGMLFFGAIAGVAALVEWQAWF